MNTNQKSNPLIAIACGGTGGHFFPGLAVAGQLRQRGCDVALLISPKDVDQQAVKSALNPVGVQASAWLPAMPARELQRAAQEACAPSDIHRAGAAPGAPFEIFTLPAVGLQNRNYFSFAGSFVKSLFAARRIFLRRKPLAVLAMGGFTSAPPIFVAKGLGVKTYLHESNTIPGRANRMLARFVDEAFVGFPEAAARLKARKVTTTGTPVRPQFQIRQAAECRAALGLDPECPLILAVGGSQGASGLNTLVVSALPLLAQKNWQWLHLTGANDFEKVKSAYVALGLKAVVKPFLAEMDLATGAATAAVSRAGASSLAEIAALRLPALLVPFPAAADNHQFFNARIYALSGAARLLEQKSSTPDQVADILVELVESGSARAKINAALELWHAPKSAEQIADCILRRSSKAVDAPVAGDRVAGSRQSTAIKSFKAADATVTGTDTGVLARGQARPKNLSAA